MLRGRAARLQPKIPLRTQYLIVVELAVGSVCIFIPGLLMLALNDEHLRRRDALPIRIAVILGLIVLTWLAERVRLQIAARPAGGRCARCGYDLRETPGAVS
jgi:undecaprenyl pyrophosphate phosphatase UppP